MTYLEQVYNLLLEVPVGSRFFSRDLANGDLNISRVSASLSLLEREGMVRAVSREGTALLYELIGMKPRVFHSASANHMRYRPDSGIRHMRFCGEDLRAAERTS